MACACLDTRQAHALAQKCSKNSTKADGSGSGFCRLQFRLLCFQVLHASAAFADPLRVFTIRDCMCLLCLVQCECE